VSRYLLDTNILSNATKPEPSASLLAWLAVQADGDLYIATLTLAEIWYGIQDLPGGRKRRSLEKWFAGPEGPQALFAGRILPFDEKAALIWGHLMAEGNRQGRPRSALDMILLAIAETNGCMVVTDNEEHFIGLPHINPMRPQT
jgi:hypothetical protein